MALELIKNDQTGEYGLWDGQSVTPIIKNDRTGEFATWDGQNAQPLAPEFAKQLTPSRPVQPKAPQDRLHTPGYKFLLPQSLREGTSKLLSDFWESPHIKNAREEISQGALGEFTSGLLKASEYLINKPIDYALGRPAGKAVEALYPKVAPYTLPRLIGLSKTTPEQDIVTGKEYGEGVREIVNTLTPFGIPAAARAAGLHRLVPQFGAARTAAEEAATATLKRAEGELSQTRGLSLTRGQEADDAARLAKAAEEKAASAKAAAESTPVPESDPIVRQLQQEANNATALAESARLRLEKAQQAVTDIPGETQAALQARTQGALEPTETGPAFKQAFTAGESATRQEVGGAYKLITDTELGARVVDTTPVYEAADKVLSQYGLTRKALPSRAENTAIKLKGRGPEGKSADMLLAEDALIAEAEPIMAARQAAFQSGSKPPAVPVELYNQFLGGQIGQVTVNQTIADRQVVRAFARAADKSGDKALARDFWQIEAGFTKALESAGDAVKPLITKADKIYKESYLPYYGFKATGTKIAEATAGVTKEIPAAVDVTEKVFQKSATRGIDSSVETARRVTRSIWPQATADLGKTFLAKRVDESLVDGVLNLDKLQKAFSTYNPLTLDIALGGTKARHEIEHIFERFSKAKKEALTAEEVFEVAKAEAKASGISLAGKEKKVSDLIKVKMGARADIAATEAKTAQEQAGLTRRFADQATTELTNAEKSLEQVRGETAAGLKQPIGAIEKIVDTASRPHPVWGSIMLVHGATRLSMWETGIGALLISGNGLSTLLLSPKGRYLLTALSGAPRHSARALTLGAQANALIEESQKKEP